jgi:GntR family transcriptional regulator
MTSVMTHPGPHRDGDLSFGRVDRGSSELLHEQVAAAIRRAIADGEAGPGQRIPKAQDLAAVLGVNTNTVLRALRLLREEGLLELGRGRSIRVTGTPQQVAMTEKARELLSFARRHGYRLEEVLSLIRNLAGEGALRDLRCSAEEAR